MNAKKILSVVTAFVLAFGLSTVAIAGPAAATTNGGSEGSSSNNNEGGGDSTTVKDATASVSVTPATCDSPATLVYGSYTHSTVQSGSTPDGTQGPSTGSGTTHYTVTFKADSGHAFSDNSSTKVFEGDLAAKKTGGDCAPPAPTCIPTSSVSYTYSYTTNSGTITVPDVAGSTHVLCNDFYVTATSWKFVKVGNTWPQMLDVTDKLGPISAPGSYDFAAAVTCGQGDIYASYDSQPNPSAVLNGPSDPFAEHFLHQMGFSGPNPTYFQQARDCTSVSPKVSTSLGLCTFANDTSSKDLTFTFDNSTSTVPVTFSVPDAYEKGSSTKGITRTVAAGGTVNVVSTVTNAGATFAVNFSGVYTVTIPSTSVQISAFVGCINATPGDPSHTDETCTSRDNKVLGSITVGLETGLVYSIDGPGTAYDVSPVTQATTTGLPAGDYVVSVVAKTGYVLTGASSWPLTITIKSANCSDLPTHPLITPTASFTNLACFASGTYTLDNVTGVLWSIGGNPVAPGTYKVKTAQTITVTAKPNAPDYGFESGISNPKVFTFVFTAPIECPQFPTDALVTPTARSTDISCSAAGSYTLDAVTGVIWSIGNTIVPAGTYSVASAQTVVVSARPDAPEFGFAQELGNPKLFTFVFTTPSATQCSQLKTLAFTGGGSTNGLIFAGGLALIAIGGLLIIRRRAARS